MSDAIRIASETIDTGRAAYDAIDACNYSTLKLGKKSMRHYRHATLHKGPDKPCFKFGRGVHLAVFEPERFAEDVAVFEGERRAGNVWKAFVEEHAGQLILKVDEYEECRAIAKEVRDDPTAAKYLASGTAEVGVEWTDTVTGLRCKGRIDFVSQAIPAIVDLKSTTNASPDAFGRQAHEYEYPMQSAMYVDAWAEDNSGIVLPFVHIAVEKVEPYVVAVYRTPDEVLEMGREDYRGLLARVAECRKSGVWPGYADGVMDLMLPRWAMPSELSSDVSDLGLDFGPAKEN